jgi:predicted ABC-class ATPase
MANLTRDDLSIVRNASGSITISAMVRGYREKTQYLFVDEDEAVADFLSGYGEDA